MFEETVLSIESVTLTDPSIGSSAKILVGFGFNCYAFRPMCGGEPLDVLWSAPGFEQGTERASGSGIPLLFPFPGRISGVDFRWEGRRYQLEEGDGIGNAIHGFVLNRSWRVLDQSGTHVTGQFQASADEPQLMGCWPADFRITVTYQLDGNALSTRILVENPDEKPLPCGLGTHPYFRLPLGGSSADLCTIQLPVTHRWELVNLLPTGKRLELPDAAKYQAGFEFRGVTLDDVFSGLQFEDGWCTARILDPNKGTSLTMQFNQAFRECVVYTPPHREAICIEPYSCVAGGFDLHPRGIDAGIKTLPSGASFEGHIEMRLDG